VDAFRWPQSLAAISLRKALLLPDQLYLFPIDWSKQPPYSTVGCGSVLASGD